MTRVPTYYQDLVDIIGKNPGHVVGSSGCLGGYLPTQLLRIRDSENQDYSKLYEWLNLMMKIFPNGDFYLELQPSNNEEQIYVNKKMLELSKRFGISYIITNDSHYQQKEDAPIHKAYLTSQEGEREVDEFYKTTYLMDTNELESFFDYFTENEIQKAYQSIVEIKNKCSDYSLKKPLKIPSLIWKKPSAKAKKYLKKYLPLIPNLKYFIESDFNGDNIMAELIADKLESDSRLQNEKIYNELNNNLETTWISSEVNKAHWSAYFLNLQKTLDVCWEAGTIVSPGRGSGVGFLLLYILDIIQINPLWEKAQTKAWRFLNPSRVSVLDIDTDIEGGRRAQVLQKLREFYGYDKVANVVTFGSETAKQALQTAARGLGMPVEDGLYFSSLVPTDRGKARTLKQCYYGDVENDFKPVPLFVQAMNDNPEFWQVAQKIEGLVCKVGEHAGGVIFVDEPFTESTALMKVPNGDTVTQFDLHDSEKVSLIKIDLLSVECLDKIHECLDLLIEQNYLQPEPTLKETYEKYLGIYNLERDDPKMWKLVQKHKIQALFQMEQQSGIRGIALTQPKDVEDLAHLNSVIRLMAQDKNAEAPLEKYARFKKNINLWYQEMINYGLTKEEQKILEPVLKGSYGICESQEAFMSLVQIPECGGFDLNFADKLRKSVAKKDPAAYEELEKIYFERVKEKGLSKNLCNYVWKVCVATSRGYGFNLSHTLAYSLVALQEMNLAYKYPIIFWNCACLIVDSGGSNDENEDEEENEEVEEEKKKTKSADYKKIALAIGKIKQAGVKVELPNINYSQYTFAPDVENNRILFGLKGMLNVGDELVNEIIAKRPYDNPKDFLLKVKPKKSSMISLIKGGAFDEMMDRKLLMGWYIWETCDKKSRLTLQNMASLIKYNLLPTNEEKQIMARRVYEFNRYLKAICKFNATDYKLDERAVAFLAELDKESLIKTANNSLLLGIKAWDKVYQEWMDVFRNWIAENKDQILEDLNTIIFKEDWDKYAYKNNLSAWEMEVLCFYYHEHELAHLNNTRYGFVDFYKLPEEPMVDRTFKKGGREIKIYKLFKICGTCIAKNKTKGTFTLMTTSGPVEVRDSREHFALYDKRISEIQPDGTKKIMEKSWFDRGNMIAILGMRSGDNFIMKKYASSNPHTIYRIVSIDKDGLLELTNDRYKGGIAEDEEI